MAGTPSYASEKSQIVHEARKFRDLIEVQKGAGEAGKGRRESIDKIKNITIADDEFSDSLKRAWTSDKKKQKKRKEIHPENEENAKFDAASPSLRDDVRNESRGHLGEFSENQPQRNWYKQRVVKSRGEMSELPPDKLALHTNESKTAQTDLLSLPVPLPPPIRLSSLSHSAARGKKISSKAQHGRLETFAVPPRPTEAVLITVGENLIRFA